MPTIPTLRATPLVRLDADPSDTLLELASTTRDRIAILHLLGCKYPSALKSRRELVFLVKYWADARGSIAATMSRPPATPVLFSVIHIVNAQTSETLYFG